MDFLTAQGVRSARIITISYGKEKPICTEHGEGSVSREGSLGGMSFVTLPFHCHVPMHEMGMHGGLVVGSGGAAGEGAFRSGQHPYDGIGPLISIDLRKGRVVLDHEEIPGFMAAMTDMSFLVNPPALLGRLHPGEAVRFTIDADQRLIVDIARHPALSGH